ncbi:hypothetical protein [Dysgonomonas sp. HGC4]|uniref:hypothetical protein n=1 Tax=Dysgonomonas sp. HGC4 TaxID=1658009 RepID=UPI0012F952DA|nr:hypothetical protein [Dysgonomonas sp. HGC4]MBD8348975.1 hypothetical protein [Dysgonomonas sp. HGC4]
MSHFSEIETMGHVGQLIEPLSAYCNIYNKGMADKVASLDRIQGATIRFRQAGDR